MKGVPATRHRWSLMMVIAVGAGLSGLSAFSSMPAANAAPPHALALPATAALPRAAALPANAALPILSLSPAPARQVQLRASYAGLPLRFEMNQGQTDNRVRFLARGAGYTLFLTGAAAVLALTQPQSFGMVVPFPRRWPAGNAGAGGTPALPGRPRSVDNAGAGKMPAVPGRPRSQAPYLFHLALAGANPHAPILGLDRLPGVSNYFVGNDPHKWRANVPGYARVEYRDVYPGVNLVYYGHQGNLEYDLVVAPGARPQAIRLAIGGAHRLRLDRQGNLVLDGAGAILQHNPLVYQQVGGVRRAIAGRYVLEGAHEASVALGRYDARRPLVIDPVLSFSTFLGGGNDDQGAAIALDSAGNIYVTGQTSSARFPTTNALQGSFGGGCTYCDDAFVTKLTPSGVPLYSTYLGGSGNDYGNGIAVDAAGDAYVVGPTTSPDFPTANALQNSCAGSYCADAFVAKLKPDGSALLYSTYLGGTSSDVANGVAVDSAGNAYVTGQTTSTDFPTVHAIQGNCVIGSASAYCADAFVVKLNADGATLVYSTYLGGGAYDSGAAIAVDAAGNAYVTGVTNSLDFPTLHALQGGCALDSFGGCTDAFVTEISADGGALVYSTFLGGSGVDSGNAIAVDGAGNAYVTGDTTSPDFPTAHAWQGVCNAASAARCADVFVATLRAGGARLLYSTYLGGSANDHSAAIALAGNDAFIGGETYSTDFPTRRAMQSACAGCAASSHSGNAFVARFGAGGALLYGTYLGGAGDSFGAGIAVDRAGTAYITGATASGHFVTAQAWQSRYGGGAHDVFVAALRDPAAPGFALPALGVLVGAGVLILALIILGLVAVVGVRSRRRAPAPAASASVMAGPSLVDAPAPERAHHRGPAGDRSVERAPDAAVAVVAPSAAVAGVVGARCAVCGGDLVPGKPFCPRCGTPAPDSSALSCRRCGQPLAAGLAFCPACGTRTDTDREMATGGGG